RLRAGDPAARELRHRHAAVPGPDQRLRPARARPVPAPGSRAAVARASELHPRHRDDPPRRARRRDGVHAGHRGPRGCAAPACGGLNRQTGPGERRGGLAGAGRRRRRVTKRLLRANWLAAGAFTAGGSLFVAGAAVAQLGSGDATTAASIYFAGGLFFSTGGYASVLVAINEPRAGAWWWWSYQPYRLEWLS